MKVKGKKNKRVKKILMFIFVFVMLVSLLGGSIYLVIKYDLFSKLEVINSNIKDNYLASTNNSVELYKLESFINDNEEESYQLVLDYELPRGSLVSVDYDEKITYEDNTYYLVIVDKEGTYYVQESNLKESYEEVVLEDKIYVRSATSVRDSSGNNKILGLADKGAELEVIGYDKLEEDGSVNQYKVKYNGLDGLVYGKYISKTKEDAIKNYQPEVYDAIHSKIKNTYDGGSAIELDFYPNEKPSFKNNVMPDSVYALYLNGGKNTISNIDSYIEFARSTNINAFVVDIKDNETPAFPANVYKELSPTNYSKAINDYETYRSAIKKLKEAGFYVIGRITVFKDSFYVKDHPETAISNINTGEPYLHNKSYWPSAYNREVWYFNVELAKEAVREMGFNEINFDYVRFPDKMNSVKNKVDLKNTYNESKAQAIQRFVSYATDSLHELEVYVSIDVFGETTNASYTTAYGQYWPAISNVADVISGMPYPDHFAANSYGIKKPWDEPYRLMNSWAKYAMDRQATIPTPAKVRTWIQAYDVMKYVDSNGIKYGAKELEDQIRGLYETGADGGYITWLSNSNLERYKSQAQAFKIDYRKEYIK